MNLCQSLDEFSVRHILIITIAKQHNLEFTTMGDFPRKTNFSTQKFELVHLCVSEILYFRFPWRSEMVNDGPKHSEKAKASRVSVLLDSRRLACRSGDRI